MPEITQTILAVVTEVHAEHAPHTFDAMGLFTLDSGQPHDASYRGLRPLGFRCSHFDERTGRVWFGDVDEAHRVSAPSIRDLEAGQQLVLIQEQAGELVWGLPTPKFKAALDYLFDGFLQLAYGG